MTLHRYTALLLLTALGCTLVRPRDTDTRAGARSVAAMQESPRLIDFDAANDSAYARCLRRPDGTTRYDEVEPYVAAHPASPSMLLAAWMVQNGGRGHPMRTAVSLDGGRTWGRHTLVPFGPCGWTDPDLTSSSDPWVAVDAKGRMYVAAVVFRMVSNRPVSAGIAVSVSTDTGRTWRSTKTPIIERSTKFWNDNASITAHPRIAGTAYVLTTRFESSDPARPDTAITSRARRVAPAVISITRDGGETWTAPLAITPRFPGAWAGAPQLMVDARTGALWVIYTARKNDTLHVGLVKSTNDGRTWSQPIPVVTYQPVRDEIVYPGTRREVAIASDLVHLAIDTTRRQLWVTFTDGRHSEGRIAQVSVTGSSDDGRTWSLPARINEDASASSWRPTIGHSRGGGAVVTYLTPDLGRARTVASDSLALPMRVEARRITLESSSSSLLRPVQVLDRFDWRSTRTDEYFLGDYFGLVSGGQHVLVYSRTLPDGNRIHALRFSPP